MEEDGEWAKGGVGGRVDAVHGAEEMKKKQDHFQLP